MNLDLTDDETAALLRELDSLIDGDRYFMSPRIKTLKAIRARSGRSRCGSHCRHRRSPTRHRGRQRSRDGTRGAELPGREAAPCITARFRWLIRAGCCSVKLKFAELCSKHTLIGIARSRALGPRDNRWGMRAEMIRRIFIAACQIKQVLAAS